MPMVKLQAAYKDYLWGGTTLKEQYGKTTDLEIVAESWELSTHPDGQSVVSSGPDAGMPLQAYLEKLGEGCLGTSVDPSTKLPILIKLIDAQQPLSIQVHPDNEYALRVENEYGKTEMWYIVDCQEGASLYFGVNQSLTKEEFKKRIEDNTVLEVLKEVPVHKGDVFFIKAGTIHAIGAGIVICEIQQNSNTTYRVYDYGRVGKDGKPRELHIDKALDVSYLQPIESDFKPMGPEIEDENATTVVLASCEYFTTFETKLHGTSTIDVDEESFASMIILEGEMTLKNGDTTLNVTKGDSVFISANSGIVEMNGNCQYIYSRA